jgi:1,4-alpha-glucan branching enzyme
LALNEELYFLSQVVDYNYLQNFEGEEKKMKKTPTKPKKQSKERGLKKQYMKTGSVCKVTFRLPKEAVKGARRVNIVGEFNDWSIEANPMKPLRSGEFALTLDLRSGKEYRFRYLVDGYRWENDWNADRYEGNVYGSDDSVVIV